MNTVQLIGRLCNDVQTRKLPTGSITTDFRIAVNRRKHDETDFITVVAWGKTAELIERYCRKGDRVAIMGRLQTRSYTNKDGVKVNAVEVVADEIDFLEKRKDTADDLPL